MIKTKEEFRQEMIQNILAAYPQWQASPEGEFAISVEVSGKKGCIYLDNIYHRLQLNREPKLALIKHFLSEFAKAISITENSLDNFDVIKKQISLVVRPTGLYKECLPKDHDGQLAFSLPVLPDLALYWAVDNVGNWNYITNAQFSKWKVHAGEVMWWAYENTCKAEKYMNTAEISEIGLLISSDRRMGTISHLLYEPINLQKLIQGTRPDWPEQPYWVCIPVPHIIIVTRQGHGRIIKELSLIAQEHYGKALSDRIYVFSKNEFIREVVRKPGQEEPVIMDLKDRIPEIVLPN
jgi:hypothetical protein